MTDVYLNGNPVENPQEANHHVSPVALYIAVFGGLLFLTAITYLVSYMNLGPASLPVAMVVATMKASLVVLFFMHLKYEERFFAFCFVTALLFVGIFFAFVLFDMSTGGELNEEHGIEYQRSIMDRAEEADNKASLKAAGESAPGGASH